VGAMDVHVMCGLLGLVWCLSCELFISRGPRAGDAGFFDPHICCCPDAGVAVAFGQHDGLEPHNHRVQSVGKKVPGVVVGSKSAKGKAHQPPRRSTWEGNPSERSWERLAYSHFTFGRAGVECKEE